MKSAGVLCYSGTEAHNQSVIGNCTNKGNCEKMTGEGVRFVVMKTVISDCFPLALKGKNFFELLFFCSPSSCLIFSPSKMTSAFGRKRRAWWGCPAKQVTNHMDLVCHWMQCLLCNTVCVVFCHK